jgi:hypothetical protein
MPLLSTYALHVPPISFFSILSPIKYWVSNADHLAPHCVVPSTPLLSHPSYTQIFSSTPYSQTSPACVHHLMSVIFYYIIFFYFSIAREIQIAWAALLSTYIPTVAALTSLFRGCHRFLWPYFEQIILPFVLKIRLYSVTAKQQAKFHLARTQSQRKNTISWFPFITMYPILITMQDQKNGNPVQ